MIKAAAGFDGDTLLNGKDPSVGNAGELSFAVGVKNIILDTTAVDAGQCQMRQVSTFLKLIVTPGSEFTALYWGVAQVCQLQNLQIKMPQSVDGNGHSGIKLGQGSTLGLADIRIENGLVSTHDLQRSELR